MTGSAPVEPGRRVTLILGYVAANDEADACGTLAAFINEVNAQTGKKINPAGSIADRAGAEHVALGC